MKPIVIKELARKFTETYYPQYLHRFERIWKMLVKASTESTQDTRKEIYTPLPIGGLAFGDGADKKLKYCMNGIAVFAFSYASNKNIDEITKDDLLHNLKIQQSQLNLPDNIQSKINELLIEIFPNIIQQQSKVYSEDIAEYNIWTENGKIRKSISNLNQFIESKEIFIDEDSNIAYCKGKRIIEIEGSDLYYNILKSIMKKGGSIQIEQLITLVIDKGIEKKITKNKRNRITTAIARLRKILLKYGFNTFKYRSGKYFLENKNALIQFATSKKINHQ